jgi:hypothetical protein
MTKDVSDMSAYDILQELRVYLDHRVAHAYVELDGTLQDIEEELDKEEE